MALAVGRNEIIGRGDELVAVDEMLERASGGFAGLVLEGEPGIGKTALWDAGRAAAAERGFRILSSRPARSDAQLSLGVFGDLFSTVSPELLARLPGPQRRALDVALLRADPGGVAVDQRTLSVATLGLVRLVATETPLLLAVDDVQWADESSAGVLGFAMRRLDDWPVGALLAARRGGQDQLVELVAGLPAGSVERCHLGPLSLAALHRLFELRLGRSFPRLVVRNIETASGGNPFYALEVGRALVRRGEEVSAGEPLPIPDSLATLTAERFRLLPDDTRDAVLLAATAPVPRLETLARAGVVDPERVLAPAVRDGVLTLERGLVRFEHPLLAQAALASVDDATLHELHVTLARAASSEDARAHHLGAAATEPDEEAAAALEKAASRARDRGASLDSVALYERASLLSPGPKHAVARALLAAEGAFIDLADLHYADAILERAVARAAVGAGRAEAMSLQALVWYFEGRQAEATQLCEEALAESGGDGGVRARILLRCAYLHGQVDMARSVQEIEEAVGILENEAQVDPDLIAEALLDRANGRLQMVRGLLADDVERGARLHTTSGRSWEWDRSQVVLDELARHTDDLETALARLTAHIEHRADRGAEDPFWFVHAALINAWLGDWSGARAWAERAIEAYGREGADLYPAFALRGLALVDALEGRVDEARRLSQRGLELADEAGDLVVATLHRNILGFVALSVRDFSEADLQLRAAAELDERLGVEHPLRSRHAGDLVEAAIAMGDLARAERAVERMEHAGRAAPTPWTLAVGARCRGLLEAARGDLDGAAEALERSLHEHERLPMPFERARTLLATGRVRHRRKEKRLAGDALAEALRLFEELGSPLWAEQARTELARAGPRRRESDELNETERRVAELAAQGLSNQEIAQHAFLSVKTVEANLTRVYRKLGIRSRAGLARRLS